jgi:hypothetical protein
MQYPFSPAIRFTPQLLGQRRHGVDNFLAALALSSISPALSLAAMPSPYVFTK